MDRDHEIEEPVSHCPEITDITGLYRGSVDQHRMELVLRVNEEYSFHHIHNAPDDVDIFPGESFHGVSFGTSEIISQRESCFVQFRPSSFLFVPNMFGPGKGPILFVPPMQIEERYRACDPLSMGRRAAAARHHSSPRYRLPSRTSRYVATYCRPSLARNFIQRPTRLSGFSEPCGWLPPSPRADVLSRAYADRSGTVHEVAIHGRPPSPSPRHADRPRPVRGSAQTFRGRHDAHGRRSDRSSG